MTQSKIQNIIFNYFGYAMSKFLRTNGCKWIDPKEFDLGENPKELREVHNDYPLVSDKIEIKWKMLPEYQLQIDDLYNSPIGDGKKLVRDFFDKKLCASLWKLANFYETRIKTKKRYISYYYSIHNG